MYTETYDQIFERAMQMVDDHLMTFDEAFEWAECEFGKVLEVL